MLVFVYVFNPGRAVPEIKFISILSIVETEGKKAKIWVYLPTMPCVMHRVGRAKLSHRLSLCVVVRYLCHCSEVPLVKLLSCQ